MYILCLKDKENEGAYAIQNSKMERTLLLFLEIEDAERFAGLLEACLLYTSPSPRDRQKSRMPSSA